MACLFDACLDTGDQNDNIQKTVYFNHWLFQKIKTKQSIFTNPVSYSKGQKEYFHSFESQGYGNLHVCT